NCDLFQNLTLGIDPKLFTYDQIKKFFLKKNKIKFINNNLIDEIESPKINDNFPFFSLSKKIVGESHISKINKISKYLKINNSDYLFVSAPENVAWILNIRGGDSPNSPVPNSRLIIGKDKKIFFIAKIKKSKKLLKQKIIHSNKLIEISEFSKKILELKGNNFIIDNKSCSIYYEDIIKSQFRITKREDPTYLLKAIKNKIEIKNMINSHIFDGAALTKFLYWIKKVNKKQINEVQAQNKLESFRKMNKNYLYPSFDTIAGSGKNGAIVHYRAKKENCRIIRKEDILLCDSGGQYKYGTTDVTRTICFSRPKKYISDIFTKVLKGHIAVANTNLKKDNIGSKIDKRARKFLKKSDLDYAHGTGHGVGFFLNVHEGPQSISKINKVKIREGMILSNEPGYYKKNSFGIRIENLIFVKKTKNKIFFENLTLAPIEKELINYKLLTSMEKNYLFKYHVNVYSKISKYLNLKERKWLASFI
ncbi:aminopeptidase P family protein, partial [Candidatus Pelagibacter sp.]|nr:aminopeptidase P family protein [Candidatus Pelagibacter sp.]